MLMSGAPLVQQHSALAAPLSRCTEHARDSARLLVWISSLAVGPHRAQGIVAVCWVAAGDAHGEPGRSADSGIIRIHAEAVVETRGLLPAEAPRGVCMAQRALLR